MRRTQPVTLNAVQSRQLVARRRMRFLEIGLAGMGKDAPRPGRKPVTPASWLNMVERFVRNLTVKRLRRGVFRGVDELVAAIDDYIAQHNEHPKPFIWTATASGILEKVKRGRAALHKVQSA